MTKLRAIPRLLLLIIPSLLLLGGDYSGSLTLTTSGTARALSAASPAPPASCISITIQGATGNAGRVYIGGSNVSASGGIGVYVEAGAAAYFSPSSTNALYTPSSIWMDASTSGDKVGYTCYR